MSLLVILVMNGSLEVTAKYKLYGCYLGNECVTGSYVRTDCIIENGIGLHLTTDCVI